MPCITLSNYGIFFALQTDARVQVVTEVMNVIRMIKVFGWEKRIDEKIADKREEELVYQRKRIVLEIISNILKCVQLNYLWVAALTILQFLHPGHHHDRYVRLLCQSLRFRCEG